MRCCSDVVTGCTKNEGIVRMKSARIVYTGTFEEILQVTCDPVWIRTKDLLLRRQLLYPAELRDHHSKYT